VTTRMLQHIDLIDIKYAVERGLAAIPEVVLALSSGDTSGTIDDLGKIVSALTTVRANLRLDEVEDDDDEVDDPQAMNVSKWPANTPEVDDA